MARTVLVTDGTVALIHVLIITFNVAAVKMGMTRNTEERVDIDTQHTYIQHTYIQHTYIQHTYIQHTTYLLVPMRLFEDVRETMLIQIYSYK